MQPNQLVNSTKCKATTTLAGLKRFAVPRAMSWYALVRPWRLKEFRAVVCRALALTIALTVTAIETHAQPPAFTITSVNSGLVLDVPYASTQPGTKIQQWTNHGGTNQKWLLKARWNGQGWEPAGYEIVPLSGFFSPTIFFPSLSPVYLALNIPGSFWQSLAPGVQIEQDWENGSLNQLWALNPTNDGNYQSDYEIVSSFDGLVLDVPQASQQPGAIIQQWLPLGGANQHWTFSGGSGSISVSGQKNAQGAWIIISGQGFPPGSNLQFRFMGVPGPQRSMYAQPCCVTADSNGRFTSWNPVYFTSFNTNDAFGLVTVAVEVQFVDPTWGTVNYYATAMANVSATYWVY